MSSTVIITHADDTEACRVFKKNLGKMLRAHGSWRKVPMCLLVDRWIGDDNQEISKQRTKKDTAKARRQFGLVSR